jgi:hypothetical protein
VNILSKQLTYAPAVVILALMCFALTGCGSEGRAPVEGTVTLDSQPVDGGAITFVPEEYKEGSIERAQVTADIKDGKYSLNGSHGLLPGKYRVVIHWSKKTGRQVADPDTGTMIDEAKEQIPSIYNANSKTMVEIPSSGNKFDYTLSSKAGDDTTHPGRPRDRARD